MYTIHYYSLSSAIEFDFATPVEITIDSVKVEFRMNKKKFLSETILTIPGSRKETDGVAHKTIKFITDVFFSEYAPHCEVTRYKTDEHRDSMHEKGSPAEHCAILESWIDVRKAVRTAEELEGRIGTKRYLDFADSLSSFADGLRTPSEIDRYLNFFKMIENTFTPTHPMEKSLKEEDRLVCLIRNHKSPSHGSEADIIKKLVGLRHECSHLKRKKPFGYTTNKKDQMEEIKGYLSLLEKVCRDLLE